MLYLLQKYAAGGIQCLTFGRRVCPPGLGLCAGQPVPVYQPLQVDQISTARMYRKTLVGAAVIVGSLPSTSPRSMGTWGLCPSSSMRVRA